MFCIQKTNGSTIWFSIPNKIALEDSPRALLVLVLSSSSVYPALLTSAASLFSLISASFSSRKVLRMALPTCHSDTNAGR